MTLWTAGMGQTVVLLTLVGFLTSCGKPTHTTFVPILPSPQHKVSELTFANVFDRVLRTNCIACHGSSGGISLETYEKAKPSLEKVFQSTIAGRRMPKSPSSALTPDQLSLLEAWIQIGAPETATGENPIQLPPLTAAFESIRYHILEPKCLHCHSAGKVAARVPLATREELLNSPLELVIPGNPDESGIVLAILNEDTKKVMPPIKDAQGTSTGFSKLPETEIRAIYDWIKNGATGD